MYSYKELNRYMKDSVVNKFDMLGFIVYNPKCAKIDYLVVGRVRNFGEDQRNGVMITLRDSVVHDVKQGTTGTIDCLVLSSVNNALFPPLSDKWEVTHNAAEFKSEIVNRIEVMPVDFGFKILDDEKKWKWDGKCFGCKTKVKPSWDVCPYCRAQM
jgi:hypothetical protein